MKQALKVGVSGVRGVVGESLTPRLVTSFAQAFGTFVGRGPVVVGRDTRPSGLLFEHAVVSGLLSVGCRPILLGIQPTPTLLMQTAATEARGGIAITASHNPGPWNALKFIERNGLFLSRTRAEAFFDVYHQQDFPLVAEQDLLQAESRPDAFRMHADRVVDYVDAEAVRSRRLRVAVDCCNGVGALHTPGFLRDGLGCDVVPIFATPNGLFEREPEPTPEHLEALCEAVRAHGCDVGFAHDPDGDRLSIVDEQGRAVGEDFSVALALRQVLRRHACGPVVLNLSVSKGIEQMARSLGSEVHRTDTGEINVVERMVEVGAVVGGEHTGGVIVPAVHPCRDSYSAMALVLEQMALEQSSISSLCAEVPRYHLCKQNVPFQGDRYPDLLRVLRRRYAGEKLILSDGLYVDFGQSWVQVRRSQTESVLRLFSEAPAAEEAEVRLAEVRGLIEPFLA